MWRTGTTTTGKKPADAATRCSSVATTPSICIRAQGTDPYCLFILNLNSVSESKYKLEEKYSNFRNMEPKMPLAFYFVLICRCVIKVERVTPVTPVQVRPEL